MVQVAANLLNIVVAGGLFAFIEFLIKRHDSKNDMAKDILKAVADTSNRLSKLETSVREDKAVQARTRILRFNDELYNGMHHSRDYFEQVLDDIEAYDKYCKDHPEFANGRTKAAAKYIGEEYQRLFKEHKL